MPNPLRNQPRPVKTLRAAPTAKCAAMATVKETAPATVPPPKRYGTSGTKAPTVVASPAFRPEHELGTLHVHFIGVHFALAGGGEVAAGGHGERGCHESRHAAEQDDIARDVGADHAGDQAEIRGQSIV